MTKSNGVFAFLLAGMLGLGCGGSGLETTGHGGRADGVGGGVGSGGSGSGGEAAGGGAGGSQTSGGSGAGGAMASGGRASETGGANTGGGSAGLGGHGGANSGGTKMLGGRGGTNAGGARTGGASGAGGTICPPVACPAIACLYGELANPDPCGCPICAPPDGGLPDGVVCGPCPMIKCQYPGEPGVDACGCPVCPPPPDAGRDAGKIACVDLDECRCPEANGCGVISETCYCPFPQCGSLGACVCGGGRFIGCAPVGLTTCVAAKARVAALCPDFIGSPFDNLCAPSDTGCVTRCLNQVTACSDMSCYTCRDCKCKADPFMTCLDQCTRALAQ